MRKLLRENNVNGRLKGVSKVAPLISLPFGDVLTLSLVWYGTFGLLCFSSALLYLGKFASFWLMPSGRCVCIQNWIWTFVSLCTALNWSFIEDWVDKIRSYSPYSKASKYTCNQLCGQMANIMLEPHDLSSVVRGKGNSYWPGCWGIRSYYPLTTCVALAPVSDPTYPSPSCPTPCIAPGSPQFCNPHNHGLIQVQALGTIINFYFPFSLSQTAHCPGRFNFKLYSESPSQLHLWWFMTASPFFIICF